MGDPARKEEKRCFGFPIQIFFIMGNEFCERFHFYGIKGILPSFLKNELEFSDMVTTVIFHVFIFVSCSISLVGAILSDSYIGNFSTILSLSMVYICGSFLLTLSALPILPMKVLTLISLLFIAIGVGGIKPCVATFGADQFNLPEENKALGKYFGWFYFLINFGSLTSMFVTPYLCSSRQCFGNDNCYSLAFGVSAMIMILALVIFVSARPWYKMKKPQKKLISKIGGCIVYAIRCRVRRLNEPAPPHWLDYAKERYTEVFITNLKISAMIVYVLIPVPMFWALFDQHQSIWTVMASRMDGDIGFTHILPEQVTLLNPAMTMLLIPMFNYILYPLLAKCNILTKTLSRMRFGGFLAVLSFTTAAIIQLILERNNPGFPKSGEGQLRIYNSLPCRVKVKGDMVEGEINALSFLKLNFDVKNHKKFSYKATVDDNCFKVGGSVVKHFLIVEKELLGHHLTSTDGSTPVIFEFQDEIKRNPYGLPMIRNFLSGTGAEITYVNGQNLTFYSIENDLKIPHPGDYTINVGIKVVGKIELKLGGVYALLISSLGGTPRMKLNVITTPNTMHMVWIVPQYLIITAVEVLFSISALEFTYEEAPTNMKALMYSMLWLTVALGSMIMMIIAPLENIVKKSTLSFIWATLMFLDMSLFTFMTWNFKYHKIQIPIEEILAAEEKD